LTESFINQSLDKLKYLQLIPYAREAQVQAVSASCKPFTYITST